MSVKAAEKAVAVQGAGMGLQPGKSQPAVALDQVRRKEEQTMKGFNKTNEKVKLTAVINGVNTQLPANTQVTLLGKVLTPQQLAQIFQAALAAFEAVTDAKASYQGAVQAQAAPHEQAHALYLALEQYLQAQFGKGSPILGQFGFSTAQRKTPSAETKAAAAAQAKLTKKAHGTDKGKRQKQAITPGGKGGLVYVEPDGKQVPGVTRGPIAPAGTTPSNSGTQGS